MGASAALSCMLVKASVNLLWVAVDAELVNKPEDAPGWALESANSFRSSIFRVRYCQQQVGVGSAYLQHAGRTTEAHLTCGAAAVPRLNPIADFQCVTHS
jgi:hypothetical protein